MAVYFIQEADKPEGPIKIGKALNVRTRLGQLKNITGKPLTVLGVIDGYTELEKDLHERFKRYRVSGEWFSPVQEILDLIITQTSPVDFSPTRKGKNTRDRSLNFNSALTIKLEDKITKDVRERAGWVPVSEIIRRLLKMWLKGEIKLDLSTPDEEE